MRFYLFVFTGKERDEETGFGYFGARYMDHELMTMWLSVDPYLPVCLLRLESREVG